MSSYASFLKTDVFKTEEFAQFELFFQAMRTLPVDPGSKVAILERAFIYNGQSIFANLVPAGATVTVIDYRPTSADDRAGYQSSWLDTSGFDYPRATARISDTGDNHMLDFDRLDCDMLLIPNVLHHCRNFPSLMDRLMVAMPNLKRVFIFDSSLRENHQAPDDFCRYTPSALEDVMRPRGFQTEALEETGNIFDAILYFISQAKVPLTSPELSDLRAKLETEIVPRLRQVRHDEKYRPLGRPFASATTAYAMTFKRAESAV